MEEFLCLHPATQITIVVGACLVMIVYMLALGTDFFNKN